MKKISKLVFVFLFAFTMFGCQSEGDAPKKVVSSYLDCIKDKDLAGAAEVSGENFSNPEVNTDMINLMFQKFDYSIKNVELDGDIATVTVDVTNVYFNDVRDKARDQAKEKHEDFDSKTNEEKNTLILEELKPLVEETEAVTKTVPVVLGKDEEGNWKMAATNSEFANSLVGG